MKTFIFADTVTVMSQRSDKWEVERKLKRKNSRQYVNKQSIKLRQKCMHACITAQRNKSINQSKGNQAI